jgi:DNA-binding GntR family transcriptional regulator
MTILPFSGASSGAESGGRRRRNLGDDVAAHIRSQILSGRLSSGERIDQDAIAETLGVSRLPVREALIALDREGLVVTVPRKGSYVQQLDRDDIIDHYQLFGQVAGLAAARACARMSDDEVAELENLHLSMQAAKNVAEQERLNRELHRLINTRSGSQRITSMVKLLSSSLPMPYADFPTAWLGEADRQHQEIIDAFRRRDTLAAQRAMEQHIVASGRHAVDVLDSMGFFGKGK